MLRICVGILLVLILMTLAEKSSAQSLDCFSSIKTTEGIAVESILTNSPSLIVFWSTKCSPCLGELPVMNQYAELNPKIKFIWVNSEEEDKVIRLADSLANIIFVVDTDSTTWNVFNPTSWGVGFAFSNDGELLWHGYTSEITEEILSAVEEGRLIEREKSKFGIEYSMVNEVGFGDHEFSHINHEDGEEWRLKNKPLASVINRLVNGVYGRKVEIIVLNKERAATPIRLRVRFHYEKGEREKAYERFLKMLCGGYDIKLSVGQSRENGLKTVVVIDYSKYSG